MFSESKKLCVELHNGLSMTLKNLIHGSFFGGGSFTGTANATREPVMEPELYNPDTNP